MEAWGAVAARELEAVGAHAAPGSLLCGKEGMIPWFGE